MKRSDDNRISQIKIPDAAVAIAAAAAQNSTNSGSATIATPIFTQRQIVDMPQQPMNASSGTGSSGVPGAGMPQVTISNTANQLPTGGSQQVTIATASQLSSAGGQLPVGAANTGPLQGTTFQRIQSSSSSGHASVSVFRSDGSVSVQPASVTSQQQPPQAHSNMAMTATPARSSTQPAPPAHITQTPITQPAGNIKPEPIALPTTPVSVQYTTTTFPGAGHTQGSVHPPSLVPPSVKTLGTGQAQVQGSNSAQNIVNLTSQASITAQPAHQQIIHPKASHGVTFGPPSGIRTITTGNLSTVGSVSSSAIVGGTPASPAGGNSNVGNGPQGNAQFQRLKVEDALSYLDQVKFKFGNQPQVYNDFLDIMKEFKTQSIDTPGVIARVSCLFKGHPELIVGFNTFLPPGYKIEVTSMNTVGVTGIPGTTGMQTIVHTPHGIHTMGAQGHMSVISTPSSENISGTISVTTGSTQQSHQPQSTRPTPSVPSLTAGLPINAKYQASSQQQTPAAHQQPSQNIIKTDNASVLPANASQQTNLINSNSQFAPAHHINQASSGHPSALTVTHHPAQREHVTVLSSGSANTMQQHTINLGQPTSNQLTGHQLPPTAHHTIPSHIANIPQGPPMHGGNSQPEFNHAINYVNKIKNRFQGQPEVYKQFLEILHTYQKDQKAIKEGNPPVGRHLTETEVYAQVSKLFQNQEDLLNEFGQFLPEATNDHATSVVKTGLRTDDHISVTKKVAAVANTYKYPKYPQTAQTLGSTANVLSGMVSGATKRPSSGINQPQPKKQKFPGSLRDVSLAEAGKFGTLNEYAFFDKVRKALRSPEVYENFLRCLVLFNQEVISRSELVQLTSTFLNRYPELFKWFKDFVGYKDGPGQHAPGTTSMSVDPSMSDIRAASSSGVPSIRSGDRGMSGEKAMEIDYATCKRLGKSYCAIPKDFVHPSCKGRTELCKQVLNDNWVSFPTWSEDSQFVTQRKTQFEEFVYRTEDERFEFDIVLETNKDTIKVLECVQKKMSRMPPEEAARYRLDDCLGGTSQTIHQRAIRRIYGDKSVDIIEGLKRNPVVAVPLVLRRLRAKDEEWREVQKNFNKVWRDQNEKHYLKSLDHQCMQFKQSDTRNLRSKSLLNEIETLYDERHEQEESVKDTVNGERQSIVPDGPHMTIEYQDPSILDDVNNLLIHHVKRQTSIHKEDKQKIKLLLRHFLMDTFKHPRQELSEDEREDEDDSSNKEDNESDSGNNGPSITTALGPGNGNTCNANNTTHNSNMATTNREPNTAKATRSERARKKKDEKREKDKQSEDKTIKEKEEKSSKDDVTEADIKLERKDGRRTPLHARDMEPDESYMHMMCNNNWYLFYRLHHILCERLTKMYNQAVIIASEESKDKKDRKECTAVALRLKPKNEIDPKDYYPAFIDMVKNLLDGNMDAQSYEDTLRELFGIHAYISFTLDKVVGNAVRQLQHLVTDEAAIECYDMYLAESKNKATGGFCSHAHERQVGEMVYQKKAEKLLADENCMKIFVYHQSCKVTIEMIDTETDGQNSEDDKEETARKYASYVDRFIQPNDAISAECKEHLMAKPVFLPRSVRSYNFSPYGKARSAEAIQDQNKLDSLEVNHIEEKMDIGDKNKDATEDERCNKDKESSTNKRLQNNTVYNTDNTQVTFNLKNFKILYVINSENCFYRKLALTRAKHSHKIVSRRKTSDFNRWHSTWVKDNVSEAQHSSINDWFMGKCDGLVNNKTHKVIKSDQDKTPYRTFYKFKAEIIKE